MSELLTESSHSPTPATDPILRVSSVSAAYGARQVLDNVSLTVAPGEIVTVLGHNGAGKTTLLKAVFGAISRSGNVEFDGRELRSQSYTAAVGHGMSFTPATLPVFRDLTVQENLDLGGISLRSRQERREQVEKMQTLFSLLGERSGQLAGTLSGGQQRILSIAMALMIKPKLMLLDEPSLGIAPSVVQQIFGQIRELAQEEKLAVLLVEQNVRASLRIADRVYYLRHGEIILEEPAEVSAAREHWWDLF